MTNLDSFDKPDKTMVYAIRIKGHLGAAWADWFEGLEVSLAENGETILTGPVIDQAALHGLLRKIRDLGMPLISVIRVETDCDDEPDESSGQL